MTHLSNNVGLAVLDNGGRARAVSGVLLHNHGGGEIGLGAVVIVSRNGGEGRESESGSGGETHFEWWFFFFLDYTKKQAVVLLWSLYRMD